MHHTIIPWIGGLTLILLLLIARQYFRKRWPILNRALSFRLPFTLMGIPLPQPLSPRPPPPPRPTTGPAVGERIVFAAEDIRLRVLTREELGEQFLLQETDNGRQAWDLVADEPPTLVICDIHLPGPSGLDLCRRVKSSETTARIPVLILTDREAPEQRLAALEAGADYYLDKPFTGSELKLLIGNALARRDFLSKILTQPSAPTLELPDEAEKDDRFRKKILAVIDANLDNPDFGVEDICKSAGMATTSLYHRVKSIFGQSTSQLIRNRRLKRAAYLLANNVTPIKEVMFKVGFKSPSYFSKAFRTRFGQSPTDYLNENHPKTVTTKPK